MPSRIDYIDYLVIRGKTKGTAATYAANLRNTHFVALVHAHFPRFADIFDCTNIELLFVIDQDMIAHNHISGTLANNAHQRTHGGCYSALPYYVGYLRHIGLATNDSGQTFHFINGRNVAI